MFRHQLLIAIRNMKKFKTSFFINFIGLATGLACALFIYLWIDDELNFDKFHTNHKDLYQVMELSKENDELVVHDGTQGLLAESMAKDFPEIKYAATVMTPQKMRMKINLVIPGKTINSSGAFAGPDFFKMFSFPVVQGKPGDILTDPNGIVLSTPTAIALFGSASASMGKPLEFEMLGKKHAAVVTGVLGDFPHNSSMEFDFVIALDKLFKDVWPNGKSWGNTGPLTYVQLKENADHNQFNAKIKTYLDKYGEESFTLFSRSFAGAYLHGKYENGKEAGGRIEYVEFFSIVALIILGVACVNFMNLSTARASRRMKEVGIKKAVGSSRTALVFQFLLEAMLMVFLSLVAACILVAIFLPAFNSITGKFIELKFNGNLLLLLAGTAVVTGIISGSYPAFYLSGFNSVAVLKGRPKNSIGELFARKGLVVFQFAVSLVLIIAVMVVYQQMKFVQSKDLGYDRSSTITFEKSVAISSKSEEFMSELRQLPGVVKASGLQETMNQEGNGASTYGISWPGKPEDARIDIAVRASDYGLIETMGMKMIEGRAFSPEFGSDSSSVIFNQTAIKIMNLKQPIGTKVRMWGEEKTIIGVVKDFHISSLHEAIQPTVMTYRPSQTALVVARIDLRNQSETLARINSLYTKWNPGSPFKYNFLDEEFQAQYISEQRVSVLARYFAGMGILIMCLGLFGLATFNAEVKAKEVSIRKILGASVSSVVYLLSKDFFKLVLISVLVSFPIAWFAMNKWLNGFYYKVSLGTGVFLIALVSIVGITILTIGFQSLKAALGNPVKSLRD
ncbi:MAG: ABC transporter permease [Chitinophagaceae bacterium]|nr:MAG: ABC transporter permease [Chitinophagaceae bacterium]